jgi:hypothetical protein
VFFAVPERVAPGKAHIDALVIRASDNSVVRALDDGGDQAALDIRHDQSFGQRCGGG